MGEVVPEREIRLDGCVNFRDVGGYRTERGETVRWRRLYRSDDLDELSERDVGMLCDGLDVRVIVDLRAEPELRRDGARALDGAPIEVVAAPFITDDAPAESGDGPLDLVGRYAFLLEHAAPSVRSAFAAVASSPGATVVHCAAGKDRTGLTVAALLGTLGVVDEDIATDYEMTARNLGRISERLRRMPAYDTWYRRVPRSNAEARHVTMLGLLAEVRARHGSMENLVRALGVEADTIARVRAALLNGRGPAAPVR